MTIPSNFHARLKLRQLALVIAIHELGSLRKASEAAKITQPAATKALQELEFNFGAPLFNRSKSGMQATVFGRLLVERSRAILNSIRATAQEIHELQEGDTGEVRVGTLPSSARILVPQAIAINRQHRPKVLLHLFEGATGQMLPSLGRGELDVVVGRIPLTQIGNEFQYQVLCADPHEVVCRVGHPLTRRKRLTLRDVVDQDWILPEEGSSIRSEFREAFADAGLMPPEPALVTSSSVVRIALLGTTDMLGFVTRHSATAMERQGILRTLNVKIISRVAPIVIVTRMLAPPAPATLSFIASLKKAVDMLALAHPGAPAAIQPRNAKQRPGSLAVS